MQGIIQNTPTGVLLADKQTSELDGDDGLLAEALAAFEVDYDYWQPEYYRAENDIDFSLGNQWPDQIKDQREEDGRPCLTENRIDVSCIQVVNDIRQTRPAVNVSPQDDKADIETAKVLKGIIRNIEQQSNANNAYDTAVENSVRGGYGWIRVNTKYIDEDSFDQEAVIETIENPFSVMIDSASKHLDGSDARRAFVFIDMPKDEFEKTYPDASPISFEPDLEQKNWYSRNDNTVRIAEYFYKDCKKVTLYNTALGPLTKEDAEEAGLDVEGLPSRESTQTKIKWCKFNFQEILEKTEWIGKCIPLVPVYGKVVWTEGRRKSFSLTYQGRDPQIRYNYQLSAETEWTALQPKAPWIAYDDQLTPQQAKQFAESNIKNFALLYHKKTYDKNDVLLPPPQRQAPPTGSPSLMQQAMVAAEGIKATLGIYDASLGARGNETSGKAILARQAEGDNATFHFVDNLATSIRQVGRILVDIIPKLYTGPTIARILGDDDEPSMVPLNQPVTKQAGKWVATPIGNTIIAPDAGRYDVSVSIGPSYATKRQEMTQNMFELYKMAPQLLEITGDIFFRNLDWDGAQELAERAKKVLPPQFQDDNPEQAALMEAQQKMESMAMQLQQMDAELKKKQDNQEFSNMLEAEKLRMENDMNQQKIAIDQQKVELERERLQLDALQAQGHLSPEQLTALMEAIIEQDAKIQDVGAAVDAILSGFEETQMAPTPPEGVANPNEGMVV